MKLIALRLISLLLMCSTLNVMAESRLGQVFPSFKLQNQAGDWIDNSKYQNSWVIYYFYPKDNTPGCSIEADNFAKNYQKFTEQGISIVGVSLDDVESHAEFAKDYSLPFDLLADVDRKLSNSLDMVNSFPWPHTRRETFIVNKDGIIVKHYDDVSPKEHVNQILKDFVSLLATAK